MEHVMNVTIKPNKVRRVNPRKLEESEEKL